MSTSSSRRTPFSSWSKNEPTRIPILAISQPIAHRNIHDVRNEIPSVVANVTEIGINSFRRPVKMNGTPGDKELCAIKMFSATLNVAGASTTVSNFVVEIRREHGPHGVS